MALHVKDSGVWKEPTDLWVKDAGIWKPVVQSWADDGGIWKPVWNSYSEDQLFTDFSDATLSVRFGNVSLDTTMHLSGGQSIILDRDFSNYGADVRIVEWDGLRSSGELPIEILITAYLSGTESAYSVGATLRSTGTTFNQIHLRMGHDNLLITHGQGSSGNTEFVWSIGAFYQKWMNIKCQVVSESHSRMKVWPIDEDEPASWMLENTGGIVPLGAADIVIISNNSAYGSPAYVDRIGLGFNGAPAPTS